MASKIQNKKLELQHLSLMVQHYDQPAVDMLKKKLAENNLELPDWLDNKVNINTQCCGGSTNESTQSNNPISSDTDELCHGIYKKLVLLVHPDKNSESIDFVNVKKACDDKDIIEMLKYVEKYGLMDQIDIAPVQITLLLEKTLFDINQKINLIHSSLAYDVYVKNNFDGYITAQRQIEKYKKRNMELKKELEEIKNNEKNMQIYTVKNETNT